MALTQHDEKAVSSDNYIKVNVWAGRIGHVSLEVSCEKGHDYLSFWPNEPPTQDMYLPRRATLNDYLDDCTAERRRDQSSREPEGVYQLPITREQADNIYIAIQDVRKKVETDKLSYTLLNQASLEEKPNQNYNCSGIVESVLSENLSLKFGDAALSYPLRVAAVMLETPGIKIIKHDAKELQIDLPVGLGESASNEPLRPRF